MSNSTSYPSPNHTGYAGLLGYTSYIPHPESLFDQACFIVCLGSKKNAFQLGLKILQILARMGIYKPHIHIMFQKGVVVDFLVSFANRNTIAHTSVQNQNSLYIVGSVLSGLLPRTYPLRTQSRIPVFLTQHPPIGLGSALIGLPRPTHPLLTQTSSPFPTLHQPTGPTRPSSSQPRSPFLTQPSAIGLTVQKLRPTFRDGHGLWVVLDPKNTTDLNTNHPNTVPTG
jgi:hypothetical protein